MRSWQLDHRHSRRPYHSSHLTLILWPRLFTTLPSRFQVSIFLAVTKIASGVGLIGAVPFVRRSRYMSPKSGKVEFFPPKLTLPRQTPLINGSPYFFALLLWRSSPSATGPKPRRASNGVERAFSFLDCTSLFPPQPGPITVLLPTASGRLALLVAVPTSLVAIIK